MTAVRSWACALVCTLAFAASLQARDEKKAPEPAEVSYYKHIRPIFVQHCQGCHQPARPQGQYILTSYADTFKAGERMQPGVVPGKPEESKLFEQITSQDGKPPKMPKGKDSLPEADVKLIK